MTTNRHGTGGHGASARTGLAACALLAFAGASTAATESPDDAKGIGIPPVVMRVGAGGAPCTHATLNAALAAAATSGTTEIRLADNQVYNAVNINISGRNVTLIGGYTSCAAASPLPNTRTRLTGTAGAGDSVVEIVGGANERNVILRNIEITGGETDVDGGGGVEIDGNAVVTFDNVRMISNASGAGGGVHISGATEPAELIIGPGSTFIGGGSANANTSTGAGGGVFCELATVRVLDDLFVASNTAAGNGGGLYLDDCNLVVGELGADESSLQVNFNEALNGGGVFAINGSLVTLRGEQHLFYENSAISAGGGMALVGSLTNLFADAVIFDGNRVDNPDPVGGLFASGGAVSVTGGASADFDGGLPQPCTAILWPADEWHACVLFLDNTVSAAAPGGSERGGALYVSGAGSELRLRQARVTGNSGIAAVYAAGDAEILIESTLFDNNASTNAVAVLIGADATIAFSTFANAAALSSIVVADTGTTLQLHATALFNAGNPSVDIDSDATVEVSCLLGSPNLGVPVVGPVFHADFIDATNDDYRPRANSNLLDRCTNAPYPPTVRDAVGVTRPVDDPLVDNGGTYDAGAYERPLEVLFADSFED